ncbi:MAG: ABC transporter substrate binding protein [Burkholderiales bacterium]
MIDRRSFVTCMGALALSPVPAGAKATRKVARVGYLSPNRRDQVASIVAPLLDGLRDRQFVEGQNLVLEVRAAEFDLNRLPALAAELVDAKMDVIVAAAPPAIVAASRATRSIPIVMAFWGGPGLLETGFVASLASRR